MLASLRLQSYLEHTFTYKKPVNISRVYGSMSSFTGILRSFTGILKNANEYRSIILVLVLFNKCLLNTWSRYSMLSNDKFYSKICS